MMLRRTILIFFLCCTRLLSNESLINWYQSYAATELNRALAQIKLHFPSYQISAESDVIELTRQMQSKSYLEESFLVIENLLPRIESGQFHIESTDRSQQLTPAAPKALSDCKTLLERYFQIHQAYFKTPGFEFSIKTLLVALMEEDNETLIHLLCELILRKEFFKRPAPKIPKRLKSQLRVMAMSAKTNSQKARALYLNYTFLDSIPFSDLEVLVQTFQENYPINYLRHLFTKLPESSLLAFRKPLEEGYGNRFIAILSVFEGFAHNQAIRSCLYKCLVEARSNLNSHLRDHLYQIEKIWIGWTKTDLPEDISLLKEFSPKN